ncbi:MAG: universal stress protein [Alphaproteobacteria bacterium]
MKKKIGLFKWRHGRAARRAARTGKTGQGRPAGRGEILLAKALELESDLLVMGGVTKYVLEHAQIPVLAFHCGARRGQGLRAHPRR